MDAVAGRPTVVPRRRARAPRSSVSSSSHQITISRRCRPIALCRWWPVPADPGPHLAVIESRRDRASRTRPCRAVPRSRAGSAAPGQLVALLARRRCSRAASPRRPRARTSSPGRACHRGNRASLANDHARAARSGSSRRSSGRAAAERAAGVEPRQAAPVDRAVSGDQRRAVAVADQRVVADRAVAVLIAHGLVLPAGAPLRARAPLVAWSAASREDRNAYVVLPRRRRARATRGRASRSPVARRPTAHGERPGADGLGFLDRRRRLDPLGPLPREIANEGGRSEPDRQDHRQAEAGCRRHRRRRFAAPRREAGAAQGRGQGRARRTEERADAKAEEVANLERKTS